MANQSVQQAMAADAAGNLIILENNAEQIANAIDSAILSALEEIGLRAEGYAKKETPVDTGRLRNSITHAIESDENAVYIGTNVKYAPYVENDVRMSNGKTRLGAHFLRDAASNHGDEYRRIFKKHMQK